MVKHINSSSTFVLMITPHIPNVGLQADNVDTDDAVVLVHPTVGPTQVCHGLKCSMLVVICDELKCDPALG